MKRPMVFVVMTLLMLLPTLVVANAATFTTIDPPGSITTYSGVINPAGAIAGNYYDTSGGHGFVRAPDGTFTTFDAPPGSLSLYPTGINPAGAITGYYYDASDVAHGFLWIP